MAYDAHQRSSQTLTARCALITLSDTRTPETDSSGRTIRELLTTAGHVVPVYQLIPDNPQRLEALLSEFIGRDDIDVILTNGGTGISRRDQTVAVIDKLLDQPLPGFGELFRMLSYQQIASAAMLSRALAGISRGKVVFAMPGSTKAVELAMTRLILPELKHLLHELKK